MKKYNKRKFQKEKEIVLTRLVNKLFVWSHRVVVVGAYIVTTFAPNDKTSLSTRDHLRIECFAYRGPISA